MKKLLSIAAAFSLLCSLAACGNAGSAQNSKNVSTENTEVGQSETICSGTITAVDGMVITMTTDDGKESSFTVNDSTQYTIEMADMPGGQPGGNPPEIPEGSQPGGNPPEMPEGSQQNGNPPEMPGGGQPGGNPPQMPEGGQPGGNPPEMPGGGQPDGMQMQAGPELLTVGTGLTVTIAGDGTAAAVAIRLSGNPGGGNADISYTAANTFSESMTSNGQTFVSAGTDENAVLVTGGEVSLTEAVIERSSSDSTGGDNASFYGVGAAVLTTDGTVSIDSSTIHTDAAGGAGVFAYGSGTACVSDTTIVTEQNTSGGIHVAGGGTLYAWNLSVETNGESAAAIRSDRGSGTMVIDGGSYTSNGIGSPAVYSTADISVNNAVLTATGSEAICIEGKNSIRLYDCELTGNMSDDSRNDCTWNVILYQSMSGDSAIGNSLFEMVGGTLTAKNGGVFYTTNTQSTFVLSGVDIVTGEDCEFLLKCTGNGNQRGWGTAGANGAQCSFTAIGQSMTGDVLWDSISTLDFYMTEGSSLTGAFLNDETNAGSGADGYASLSIAQDCTWTVTKDSTLSSLKLSGRIVDEDGKTACVVGTDGMVYIAGDSGITVTVGSFSDTADMSGGTTPSCFADYSISRR